MADQKKDIVDNFIDFILSDDRPVQPEDRPNLDLFQKAVASGKQKLARARLERAKAGAAANRTPTGQVLDLESARQLLARAKAGDKAAEVTLAARFGDGSMDEDMEAILEDLAELEAESRDED